MKRIIFILAAILFFADFLYSKETLTWQDCVNMAIENNPDLKSSLEKVRVSKANVGIARSGYLPQINANASATTSQQTAITTSRQGITTTSDKNSKNYSYSITGKQQIFDSMKTVYDIKAANSMVEDSRYEYAAISSQIRLNLRVAFVKLLKAQESLVISKEIVKRRLKNYELVTMRYKAGREHKGSLLNAEASLAQAKYELLQAERNISVAQRNLFKEMGISSFKPAQVKGTLAYVNQDRDKPDFDSIMQSNPQVLRIIKQRESALYNKKSKMASFLPVISATASAGKTDTKWPPKKTNLSAGIEITVPIFEGGSNYYNFEKSDAEYQRLKADEKSMKEKVLLDLEQKWINWQNGIDTIDVQRKFLRAAEERAKIAEAQYSIGLLLFDNWIIIEDDLARLKRSYLDALANELIAEAEWVQAIGETLDYDK